MRFDEEFMSEEELEDTLDAFIEPFMDLKQDCVSVINPIRLKEVSDAYKIIKQLTAGTKATVSYELNEPFNNMASISIEGKALEFKKIGLLTKVIDMASNFEVYPKTNGKLCLCFCFYGLTKDI